MSSAPPRPLKRRRTGDSHTHHALQNVQHVPAHTEPAAQDATFIQGQMLKSIGAALTIVGYDGAASSALEAFRAETEEYILHFLRDVTLSMTASRRTTPIPSDFTVALSTHNLSSTDFYPHLSLALPAPISAPAIAAPTPAEPPPTDLSPMLGSSLTRTDPSFSYIPSHFPALPSRHAWQSTPVFTDRERDPRKMRERATEEGILAEQALRRLTSARKPAQSRGERGTKRDEARAKIWLEVVGEMLGDEEEGMAGGLDGSVEEEKGGLRVNFERAHWRRGGPGVRT